MLQLKAVSDDLIYLKVILFFKYTSISKHSTRTIVEPAISRPEIWVVRSFAAFPRQVIRLIYLGDW